MCNDARQRLSISGWNAKKYPRRNERLPYCWAGAYGGANYNEYGDSGPNFRASKVICKRLGKFILFFRYRDSRVKCRGCIDL